MEVAIFGTGAVGSQVLFSILEREKVRPLFDEIFIVNRRRQTSDMLKKDCLPGFLESYKKIKAITYDNRKDIGACEIIIITAGRRQSPGESRLALAPHNKQVIKWIFKKVKLKKSAIVIVVTNPVELMTQLVWKLSGLPSDHVIGFGGELDARRLKLLLSSKTGKNPDGIKCYILGEHGERLIPVFRERIKNKKELTNEVRSYADDIIGKRGFTSLGPGQVIVDIVRMIVHSLEEGHRGPPLHVAYYDKKHDVYITCPCYFSFREIGKGVVPYIPKLSLKERKELNKLMKKKVQEWKNLEK